MALTKIDDRGLKTPIDLIDNEKIRLGTGNDLEIYHDASNSYIKDTGTGDLNIAGSIVRLQSSGGETLARGVEDGAFELYHNNIKTFQTSTNGIQVFGPEGGNATQYFYADEGDDNADEWGLIAHSSLSKFSIDNYAGGGWETSLTCEGNGAVKLFYDDAVKFETKSYGAYVTGDLHVSSDIRAQTDNGELSVGAGDDLKIWHDGTDTYLKNITGGLVIQGGTQNNSIYIRPRDGENSIQANSNGSVDLYYDNVKKFSTTSTGVNINGDTTADTWNQNVLIVGTETLALGRAEANNAGPHLHFYKSRNGTWGSNTIVQDDDQIGNIIWYGDDGTDYKSALAMIQGAVDGTPGTNDMPGRLVFYTTADGSETNAERMRIDNAGNVLIGTTVAGTDSATAGLYLSGLGSVIVRRNGNMSYWKTLDTSSYNSHVFLSANTTVGTIVVASSSTTYNTSSDYRLKENVSGITDGITRVKQLKPSKFNWISDDTNTPVDGFLAHEVSSLVPEAITGTKDAVATEADDEACISIGDPVYQQIDHSKLVPLLTAALKESITKIETLETKVAALEAA